MGEASGNQLPGVEEQPDEDWSYICFSTKCLMCLWAGVSYYVGTIFDIHTFMWRQNGIGENISPVPMVGNVNGRSMVRFRTKEGIEFRLG